MNGEGFCGCKRPRFAAYDKGQRLPRGVFTATTRVLCTRCALPQDLYRNASPVVKTAIAIVRAFDNDRGPVAVIQAWRVSPDREPSSDLLLGRPWIVDDHLPPKTVVHVTLAEIVTMPAHERDRFHPTIAEVVRGLGTPVLND